MTEFKIMWHPYPKEMPKLNVDYLVTYKGFGFGVRIGFDSWQTNESWASFRDDEVIAWAEMPEPYEPPKRDPYYNHPDEITARKYMERDPETLKALGIFD